MNAVNRSSCHSMDCKETIQVAFWNKVEQKARNIPDFAEIANILHMEMTNMGTTRRQEATNIHVYTRSERNVLMVPNRLATTIFYPGFTARQVRNNTVTHPTLQTQIKHIDLLIQGLYRQSAHLRFIIGWYLLKDSVLHHQGRKMALISSRKASHFASNSNDCLLLHSIQVCNSQIVCLCFKGRHNRFSLDKEDYSSLLPSHAIVKHNKTSRREDWLEY